MAFSLGMIAGGLALGSLNGMKNNQRKKEQKYLDYAQAELDTKIANNNDKNEWYANNKDYGASTMSKNNRQKTSDKIKANNDSIREAQETITKKQSAINNKGGLF